MLTTSQLRVAWGPPCQGPWAEVTLFGGAVVHIDPLIVDAALALDGCLRAYNYPTRTQPYDTGAFNCRHITGGTGYSLHAYGIAIDIRWQENPYGPRLITTMPPAMVAAIEAIRTNNGMQVWRWGGHYSGNKDAMHYEVVCSPADLATGIRSSTSPAPKTKDDADMALTSSDLLKISSLVQPARRLVKVGDDGDLWVSTGLEARRCGPKLAAHLHEDFLVPDTVVVLAEADAAVLGNAVRWTYFRDGQPLPDGFDADVPASWR